LDVLFGDVRGGAADLDVGAVGFENPCHRVLAAPVVIVVIIIVVPVTHPLVIILTVSHVPPSVISLEVPALKFFAWVFGYCPVVLVRFPTPRRGLREARIGRHSSP
jgi:hypothetical protein